MCTHLDPTHSDDCECCGKAIKTFPQNLTYHDDDYDALCESCAIKLNNEEREG